MTRRNWTSEEVQYLQDKWGVASLSTIARHLSRSFSSIKQKSQRMGLSDPTLHFDGITVSQLMRALDKSYNAVYPWIRDYGMPVKEKIFVRKLRIKVITYEDFWDWAEQHKELINFSKVEPNALGAEPEWVKIKRKADQIRSQKTWRSVAWSEQEDQQLQQMVKFTGMTYPRLAKHFNRSESAIKRRLYDLNIKFRPERLDNMIKYTPDEVRKLAAMARQGYAYETIAQELGKSALGVRGKLERLNFDFKKREFREVETLWKLIR